MAPPEPEVTTIDSLPIELLTEEVLLRLATPADLVCAAATKRSWRGAIANDGFLTRYRKRHRSSPFLGLFVRPSGLPPRAEFPDDGYITFQTADFDERHHLYDAANRASSFCEIRRCEDHRRLHDDVDVAFIPDPEYICLLDCRNSRLLLTRGYEVMEVRSPLAREAILFPLPPDSHLFPMGYLEDFTCLLQGHDGGSSSFRVVHLQHMFPQVRAVEYDSTRKTWQDHPWVTLSNIRGTPQEVMHAGHRIFCTYTGLTSAAIMLDTSNMQFSLLPLPCDTDFAIGEGEDNTCCLVEYYRYGTFRMRVWQLDEEKLVWDLNKDIRMCDMFGHRVRFGWCRPRAVSNGTVLLCSEETFNRFVVDLNTGSVKGKFRFQGQLAYLMQMPWPPAFSSPANGARSPGRSPVMEGNMSVGSYVLASAGCDAPLQGSISDPFSQKDKHEHTAAVDTKSCRQNSSNLPHCVNVEEEGHGGSSNQSHEALSTYATVTPGFDRTSDVLGTDASEPGHLPEGITAKDGDRGSAEKTSNDEKSEDASPEISVRSKDQDIDDGLEGLSQQDLCIKCGKDGELLTCSDCSLAAHLSCFGSSVTFEGTDLFYCPVCSCKKAFKDYLKAKEKYSEAEKNANAYIATAQVSQQHDEQLNGVQPGAAKRDGHLNGSDMSKRNSIHQNETYDLAHQDEEPHQPRKKQKINAGGNGYPKEVHTEKVPFLNSGPASMNKHSVLQNNKKAPEKRQQEGDKEALKEAGKPRKRSYVYPQKRYSNPVAPTGRRRNLAWTNKEEACLREAMAKFTPQNGAQIPWTQIRKYGSDVFHKTRLPEDLRVKWRSMNKKCAGY